MQLTSNASINLVPPQTGDWSDVQESRVNGPEQRSSQQQHRKRDKVRGDREMLGEKDTEIELVWMVGFGIYFL